MNKKLLVALAVASVAVSSASFADVNRTGFYVGAQGGVSRANDGDYIKNYTEKFDSYEWKQGGFGWRALAGYQINNYFAIEGGYTGFAKNTYRTPLYDIDHKTSAWDLVGKAILPISNSNFDVYAKAGAAYQKTQYDGVVLTVNPDFDSNSEIRPIAGIGAGYHFANGLGMGISWTRVFGRGTTTNPNDPAQPKSDLIALGLSYTFQQWA